MYKVEVQQITNILGKLYHNTISCVNIKMTPTTYLTHDDRKDHDSTIAANASSIL